MRGGVHALKQVRTQDCFTLKDTVPWVCLFIYASFNETGFDCGIQIF